MLLLHNILIEVRTTDFHYLIDSIITLRVELPLTFNLTVVIQIIHLLRKLVAFNDKFIERQNSFIIIVTLFPFRYLLCIGNKQKVHTASE